MAALVQALDNYTSIQIGENGHSEYGWSNSIQENILQLYFQLTRGNETSIKKLEFVLKNVIGTLKTKYEMSLSESNNSVSNMLKHYLIMVYKMIGQTRDIIDGKGEYNLTYMMIQTLYGFYPELSLFLLNCCVKLPNNEHPYGSWIYL